MVSIFLLFNRMNSTIKMYLVLISDMCDSLYSKIRCIIFFFHSSNRKTELQRENDLFKVAPVNPLQIWGQDSDLLSHSLKLRHTLPLLLFLWLWTWQITLVKLLNQTYLTYTKYCTEADFMGVWPMQSHRTPYSEGSSTWINALLLLF